ncbi:MAG: Ig-like domain-containing protein [Prochlorococcaceae cyanobacterium]
MSTTAFPVSEASSQDAASSEAPVLAVANAALGMVWSELGARASEPAFLDLLAEVFGASPEAAEALAARLAAGDSLGLRYEIKSGEEMAGTLGAYAALGDDGVPTIYLNGDWLAGASDAEIRMVLLEEIGHSFDTALNGDVDTAGDEGELFANLFSGVALSDEQRAAILAEDDSATLTIDGALVAVEAAVSAANIASVTTDSGTSGDFITNDQSLSFTIVYTSTTSNPLSIWIQSGSGLITRLGTVSVSNNQASGTATYDYMGTTLAAGAYTFYLTATGNSVTNWSSVTDVQKLDSQVVIIDVTPPSLTISSDQSVLRAGETAVIAFSFSESPTDFTEGDITTTGGTLSDFAVTADPKVYTATFTPAAATNNGTASITVAAGAYTDLIRQ